MYLVPRGGVILWHGSSDAIPKGWAICDGTQGTPDMRDRFVVGAGGKYALDGMGGAESATPDVSTGTAKTGARLADAAPGGTAGSSGTGIGIQNAALNIWTGAAGTGIGVRGRRWMGTRCRLMAMCIIRTPIKARQVLRIEPQMVATL